MYWKRLLLTVLIGLFTSLPAGVPAAVVTAAGGPAAIAESQQTSVDEKQQAVKPTVGRPAVGTSANDDTNETKETAEQSSKTEPQPVNTPRRRAAVSRNFRPSEQITADNSVAYPVDI